MNRLLLSTSLSLLLFTAPAFADTAIPAEIATSLASAYKTGDSFVIQATKEKLAGIFPEQRANIAAFNEASIVTLTEGQTKDLSSVPNTGAISTANQLNAVVPSAGEEDASPWSGTVEGGLNFATGNTEEENVNAKGELVYEVDHWKNKLTASARNEKSVNTRTAEEYKVENQLNYKINERHYIFGEAGYVDDRFSGYDYRINEGLGYGYYFIKEDTISLLGEIGGGGRHSKFISGDKEDELVAKASEEFEWDINDRLSFEQDASVEYGEELTVLNASAGLKADIYQSLYLKLGFEVENLSTVPTGVEKTDTLTSVNLGYDF